MSELQNPLFDEEKDFLERKKLEYERALRGDVEHIKEQSVMVGKVALVGAGLAGGIWLITKAFGGKKRKKRPRAAYVNTERAESEADHDYEFGSNYYGNAKGKEKGKTDDGQAHKSAAESAMAFMDHHEHTHEADDLGFGSTAAHPDAAAPTAYIEPTAFDADAFEDDPFKDLPYDDSRRLPASHAFDDNDFDNGHSQPAASPTKSRSRMIGSVLQAFLQTDTGKVLVGQVAAVALALVTKKVSEFFPAAKNSDLATSPGHAPAATGDYPAASAAPSVPSDASTQPQSL